MRTKWRIYCSQPATAYLVGMGELGLGIQQVIDRLAQVGVPANADKDETAQPVTHTWTAVGHIITCIVAEEEQAIYVAEVEPMDIGTMEIVAD